MVCFTSDGTIRVFTEDSSRVASVELRTEFESELASSNIDPKSSELGGISTAELPGRDHLEEPGEGFVVESGYFVVR